MRKIFAFVMLTISASVQPTHAALPLDPIDVEIEKIKPRPGDPTELAAKKCLLLAQSAKARGVSTLLLGIEGQDGFKADNAWLVYRYLWRITHGIPDAPPLLDTAAPILHRLILPLIDHLHAGIEVLDFPETSVTPQNGGVPEVCAKTWIETVERPKLFLFGHSFGADAIYDLSVLLEKKGIPVHQAYSLDAIGRKASKKFQKPGNVKLWANFYQRNEPPFGSYVAKAEANRDLSKFGVNHRTIVRSAPVMESIKSNLKLP